MCLCSLLVLPAAASTTNPFLPEFNTFISCWYYLPVLRMYWPRESTLCLHIPHCRHQVGSLTTLAWESLRLGLGRDWTPSVIFRTLSLIWILSVGGHYFVFRCDLVLCIVSVVFLTRLSRLVYISSVVVAEYSRTVVMLSQVVTWNRLLCEFRRKCWNLHSARDLRDYNLRKN